MKKLKEFILEKLIVNNTIQDNTTFTFGDESGTLTINVPFEVNVKSITRGIDLNISIIKVVEDETSQYIYWDFYDDEKHRIFSLSATGIAGLFINKTLIMPKVYLKAGIQNVTKSIRDFARITLIDPDKAIVNKKQIHEKLIVNNTIQNEKFSDEELRKDYDNIGHAIIKAEKQVIADKYGVTDLRIKPIQIAILDKLRENRNNKKEFTKDDIVNFHRYDIPDNYNKLKSYLDQEPRKFVEYLLEYYKDIAQKTVRRYAPRLSAMQNYQVRRYKNIERYLEETK